MGGIASRQRVVFAARRNARRIAKLVWWTISFQAPGRVATKLRAAGAARRLSAEARKTFRQHTLDELDAFLASRERLLFPQHDRPDISVVIVLWNAAHYTLHCLRTLVHESRQQGTPSFEVILVDNASTDHTSAVLGRVDGARIIENHDNLGFVDGCNIGAAVARGDAVLLLNSDAFVRHGTLAAALEALQSAPDVGAVGGRLVLPEGVLQEAGCIVWSDASTLGYCRNAPAEAGEAMFRRTVDYCSGAFLLTPRSVWQELGGLDTRYRPAYYDDVDYCWRVSDRGLRVVYEPFACVDHVEKGSDADGREAPALTIRNTKVFRGTHGDRIRSRPRPGLENILAARSTDVPRGRLLFIDNEIPHPWLGSGYPRAAAMIAAAANAGWEVTVFGLHAPNVDWDRARRDFPREVELIADRTIVGLLGFLQERRGFYDTFVVSRPDNMRVLRNLLRADPTLLRGVRLVYDAEALFANRVQLEARWTGVQPPADASVAAEVALARDADAVLCVTEAEAQQFRELLDLPVHVISHPVGVRTGTPAFDARRGFLFVGRLLDPGAPNWLGLRWFVQEVWPLIRARLPEASLEIAGHLADLHDDLLGPGISAIGPVEDLGPVFDRARVFVAPVHVAAGLPLKVLEATANGLPSAATTLMGRQLGWLQSDEIRCADDPTGFAAAAIALHEEPIVWSQQAQRAMERVARENARASFADDFVRTLTN